MNKVKIYANDDERNVPIETIEKVSLVLDKLASTIEKVWRNVAAIGSQNSTTEIIKKTFSNFSTMFNTNSTLNPTSTQSLLHDDNVFNQPSFLEAISALEASFMKT